MPSGGGPTEVISAVSEQAGHWIEVGERVFTRRYRFMHQQIGAILTEAGPVVIDTRSTVGHAREILADLHEITSRPVAGVINTHHHFDHTFGNHELRPAPIWGHVRCIAGSGEISRIRPPTPGTWPRSARSTRHRG